MLVHCQGVTDQDDIGFIVIQCAESAIGQRHIFQHRAIIKAQADAIELGKRNAFIVIDRVLCLL